MDVEIITFDYDEDARFNREFIALVTKYFKDNPLNIILPVPEEVLLADFRGKRILLATCNKRAVGAAAGSIMTYAEFKSRPIYAGNEKMSENVNRTRKFLSALTPDDLSAIGINSGTLICEGAAAVVAPEARQSDVGTQLLQRSLQLAKSNKAEFYVVHVVNSVARRICEKYGFQVVKTVLFRNYFKNDPDVLTRLDPKHEAAFFMIKKL